jgi:hypothetical protein
MKTIYIFLSTTIKISVLLYGAYAMWHPEIHVELDNFLRNLDSPFLNQYLGGEDDVTKIPLSKYFKDCEDPSHYSKDVEEGRLKEEDLPYLTKHNLTTNKFLGIEYRYYHIAFVLVTVGGIIIQCFVK